MDIFPLSFVLLMKDLRNGDLEMNLGTIYKEQGKEYLRFAMSLTGDRKQAEDLVHQSYVKALEQEELFQVMHPEQIKGWFFRTVKNLFIDDYRREKRFSRNSPESAGVSLWITGESTPGPEKEVLEKLDIRENLDKLPQDLQSLVVDHYYFGYTIREIGERRSINPSTLRSRLQKAHRILRKKAE